MKKAIFVTGTDTDAGKTFISSIIVRKSIQMGKNTAYIKPMETGLGEKLIPLDYTFVSGLNPEMQITAEESVPLRFQYPFSPYESALLEKKSIHLPELVENIQKTMEKYDFSVIEGAGGVLVPITDKLVILDFIKMLHIEAVVVGKCGLGTINHTCLTIQALLTKNISVPCYILTGKNDEAAPRNSEHITRMTGIPCAGIVPFQNVINSETMERIPLNNEYIFHFLHE